MRPETSRKLICGVRNVRLTAGGGTVELAIQDGRLSTEPIEGTNVLDGGGAWLHPGFVDAHLHMAIAAASQCTGAQTAVGVILIAIITGL